MCEKVFFGATWLSELTATAGKVGFSNTTRSCPGTASTVLRATCDSVRRHVELNYIVVLTNCGKAVQLATNTIVRMLEACIFAMAEEASGYE
jgi:hypothetical protein